MSKTTNRLYKWRKKQMNLLQIIEKQPIIPFIRETDLAIREPWYIPERRLLDYLLKYIQEGECIVKVSGTEYHLQKGDFCFIQPGDLHTLRGPSNSITPYVHMDIFFNQYRSQNFPTIQDQDELCQYKHLLQYKLNDLDHINVPVKLRLAHPITFREKMLKMIEISQNSDVLSILKAQHLATDLIMTIIRDHSSLHLQGVEQPQVLSWVEAYVSFHMQETITVEDLAQRAQLSPSRFNTVFKQKYGMSPHQYLLNRRVQHVQELLKTTNSSINRIAEYTGFADAQHLSKSFKKLVGCTPGAFRKKL